jgi:uncharacterized protein GlcG (DUF336 family)
MRKALVTSLTLAAALSLGTAAWAQTPPPPPPMYGPGMNLETAKKAVEAAMAEAKKNGWFMAVTAVTIGGYVIHASTMDGTQFASIQISQHKAKAAAMFRRPTKVFEDRVAQGGAGIAVLSLDGVIASEGGLPIMKDGKVIGGLGCSGGTGQQDGIACKAGVDAVQ